MKLRAKNGTALKHSFGPETTERNTTDNSMRIFLAHLNALHYPPSAGINQSFRKKTKKNPTKKSPKKEPKERAQRKNPKEQ
jgi:hypothetical protein